MNLDETQALELGQDYDDEEEEVERSRKLVGHLKVFKHQDFEERVFKIYEGENFIGRDEICDVQIPRKSLSKTHACIEVVDNLHVIYDNGSKNKTRRDKVTLRPHIRYEIKNGDMLTIADLSLQYIVGDMIQVDDDDDDTGSETGSESMLTIGAAAASHNAVGNDDSATDDEKIDNLCISKTEDQGKPDDKAMTDEVVKPKVPNVMFDSSDEEVTEKPLPHPTAYQDEDSALNVSSEGTLAFGLSISPTDRPFIRPTPKQAIKETQATLVFAADSQDTSIPGHLKCSTPSTLLYSEGSPGKSPKPSPKQAVMETPATMVYSADSQGTNIQGYLKNSTPNTLLYSEGSPGKSPKPSPKQAVIIETPSTMVYSGDCQDTNIPGQLKSPTPGTLLYGGENSPDTSPSKTDNPPGLDETSDEIFLPETQGFTPHDVSVCAPTQAYIEDTPIGTEEKPHQVSNIPESGDEGDPDVKKLSFDESATQAYSWNDSDATNDDEEEEDDDLRYQATQAYPSNPAGNKGFSSDEHSNPDLYATTRQEHGIVAQPNNSDTETEDTKLEATMGDDLEFMETQAYNPCDKTKSKEGKHPLLPSDLDAMETQGYATISSSNQKDTCAEPVTPPTQAYSHDEIEQQSPATGSNDLTKEQEHRRSLQALPATLAYDIQENNDKTFAKPLSKGNCLQNVEQTLPYMMETQAYDVQDDDNTDDDESNKNITSIKNVKNAQDTEKKYDVVETQPYGVHSDDDDDTDDDDESDKNITSIKNVKNAQNTEQKLQYDMMETQAYDVSDNVDTDDDVQTSARMSSIEIAKKAPNEEPKLQYNMMETQAYDVNDEVENDNEIDTNTKDSKTTQNIDKYGMMETQTNKMIDEQEAESSGKVVKFTQHVEPTLEYDMKQTQAYEASPDSPQPGPSINMQPEPTLPYTLEEDDQQEETGVYEAMQAYGLDDQTEEAIPDSEETMGSQEIHRVDTTKNDKNNNKTSKGSTDQKVKEVQEEQSIVIRPLRRGRGRVTQTENEQNLHAQKSEGQHIKQDKEEENKDDTEQKGVSETDEENDNSIDTTVSLSKSKRTQKGKQDVKEAAIPKPTSLRSKRMKRGTAKVNQSDENQLDTKTDELEAPTSVRGKRAKKGTLVAKANQAEDKQLDIEVCEQKDYDLSVKAPVPQRKRRAKRGISVPEVEEDNLPVQEPTSSRRQRLKKGEIAPEINPTVAEAKLSDVVTTDHDDSDVIGEPNSLKRKQSKQYQSETDQAKSTLLVKDTLESDDHSLDSATNDKGKSTTKTPRQPKAKPRNNTEEVHKATQGRRTRKSTRIVAAQEEQSSVEEICNEKDQESVKRRRTGRSSKDTTVTEQTHSAPVETGESSEEKAAPMKGRARIKNQATQEEQKQCVHENTEHNKELPTTRTTNKSTKKVEQELQNQSLSEDLGGSKSEKDQKQANTRQRRKINKNYAEQEEQIESLPEEFSKTSEKEKHLPHRQDTGKGNKSKEDVDSTANQTISDNTEDDDFKSSRSSRTRKAVKQANKSADKDGCSSVAGADVASVHTIDSKGDQFSFKGQSKTRKKGKHPKKLVKNKEMNIDSDEPSSLGDILSDKIQERTLSLEKNEHDSLQDHQSITVRQEKDRQFTLALDNTQDSILDNSSTPDHDKSQRPKAVSSRRGRGRVTQSEDSTVIEDQATPSKRRRESINDSIISTPSLRERRHTMPRVMFTGVTDQQAEKIVTSLGGALEESIYDCTHLITDKVRRTVKFLCAVAAGLQVILPKWLTECKRNKTFIDPEPFIVQDKAAEKQYSFSLKQSLDQATEKGLLDGYKVHVTKNVKPDPTQMKDIIKCARGEYLSRMPRSKEDNVLVISCQDDQDACQAAIACGIPVYSAELLLTGVLRHELLLDQNLLFTEDLNETQSSTSSNSSSRKRRNQPEFTQSSSSSRSTKRKKK